jgi:hypothetical protein
MQNLSIELLKTGRSVQVDSFKAMVADSYKTLKHVLEHGELDTADKKELEDEKRRHGINK